MASMALTIGMSSETVLLWMNYTQNRLKLRHVWRQKPLPAVGD